jgi:YD repeat-containing protein
MVRSDYLAEAAISTCPGRPDETVQFDYDEPICTGSGSAAVGRLTQMSPGASYCYERRGLLTTEMIAQSMSVAYRYDEDGNRSAIVYPSGRTATYGFDRSDRPTSVSIDGLRS